VRRQLEFEILVERLKANPLVDGLMLMGSTGKPTQNPYSDRDLLVVLADRPLTITNGTVFCQGVLPDLVFTTRQEIVAQAQVDPGALSWSDPRSIYCNWMPSGTIVLDRSGCLATLRDKVVEGAGPPSFGDGESNSRADKALYNLAQTERMLDSPDQVYQQAIDLRMLYQLANLMVDYFWVRGMPWKGEKDAVRHWQANDSDYLALFMDCCRETSRPERIRLYRRLVEATVEPVGLDWSDRPAFVLSPPADMTRANIDAARAFWQTLLA